MRKFSATSSWKTIKIVLNDCNFACFVQKYVALFEKKPVYLFNSAAFAHRSQNATSETEGDRKAGIDGCLPTWIGDAECDKQ